jgi:hypothetical protein
MYWTVVTTDQKARLCHGDIQCMQGYMGEVLPCPMWSVGSCWAWL